MTHLLHQADYSCKVALQPCILKYKPAKLLGQDRINSTLSYLPYNADLIIFALKHYLTSLYWSHLTWLYLPCDIAFNLIILGLPLWDQDFEQKAKIFTIECRFLPWKQHWTDSMESNIKQALVKLHLKTKPDYTCPIMPYLIKLYFVYSEYCNWLNDFNCFKTQC